MGVCSVVHPDAEWRAGLNQGFRPDSLVGLTKSASFGETIGFWFWSEVFGALRLGVAALAACSSVEMPEGITANARNEWCDKLVSTVTQPGFVCERLQASYCRDLNLLAHLHLSSGCNPDTLTANVLADYLGRYEPVASMADPLKERLMPGILLHRRIDLFTDQHPVVAKARDRISADRRRLGGIILDIAFDYYLTRHWHEFSDEERHSTISRGYATMAMVASTGLSRKTQSLISKMRSSDWLAAYGTLEGQALTYQKVSRVTPAVAKLIGSEEEIVKNDSFFEQCFLAFYPDLVRHVSDYQKSQPSVGS